MLNYTQKTINYIETGIETVLNNIPKTIKTMKSQHEGQSGIFEILPTNQKEIAEMIVIYNKHKFPTPNWITNYEIRSTHSKSPASIPTFVADGRIRTKEENGKVLYAEEDVKMFSKFNLLFSLAESKQLVSSFSQPQLDLSLYLRYNMKEKGKDIDIGKVQVMHILLNEFVQIRLADKQFRNKLKDYLEATE